MPLRAQALLSAGSGPERPRASHQPRRPPAGCSESRDPCFRHRGRELRALRPHGGLARARPRPNLVCVASGPFLPRRTAVHTEQGHGGSASDSFFTSARWQEVGKDEACSLHACGQNKRCFVGGAFPQSCAGSWQGLGAQGRRWGRRVTSAIEQRLVYKRSHETSHWQRPTQHYGKPAGRGSWERGGAAVALVAGSGGQGGRRRSLGGDSQDEGAGFLEPTEGLEKPTGVLTLPGQSFDGLDDLVMQIAESGEGEGRSDREKTELEQQARHLGVPSAVGTLPRPLEPKHAAGERVRHGLSILHWGGGGGVRPRVAPPSLGGPGSLRAEWVLQPGGSDH